MSTKEINMDEEKVKCAECGTLYKQITKQHVKMHGFKNIEEYLIKHPGIATISKQTLSNRRKSRCLKIDKPQDGQQVEHNLHVSVARTRKRISYEEFLDLIKQNVSLVEMRKKLGISKHQIGFYSALAQNKLNIKKEQFEKEYKSGRSLDQISEKYNIQRDHITQLREFWGIKRLGAKYIHRKKTEKPLSFHQKKIVYGGLMGDAGKMSFSSIKMKQSLYQKDYLLWKYSELKEHISPTSLQVTADFDKRYNKRNYEIIFYTHANSDIEKIVQKFYCNGQKAITDDILNHIDDLALAIWFMDDGTTDWYTRLSLNHNPACQFCTDSFSFEEVQLMCDAFEEMWDITAQPRSAGKKKNGEIKYRMKFNVENTQKLFSIIEPYIIPSMRYKVNKEDYCIWREKKNKRKELEKINRIGVIRQYLHEIDEYLIKNHPDQNDKLNIFANKHVESLFKGELNEN